MRGLLDNYVIECEACADRFDGLPRSEPTREMKCYTDIKLPINAPWWTEVSLGVITALILIVVGWFASLLTELLQDWREEYKAKNNKQVSSDIDK